MAEKTKARLLAEKYYPTYWSKERLARLVRDSIEKGNNNFTAEDYKELTGEEYEG